MTELRERLARVIVKTAMFDCIAGFPPRARLDNPNGIVDAILSELSDMGMGIAKEGQMVPFQVGSKRNQPAMIAAADQEGR